MKAEEWIMRFSARLRARWPRLPRMYRDEVATEIFSDPRWQELEPEHAAVEWLARGGASERSERRSSSRVDTAS